MIVPVLDGLDDLSSKKRETAVKALNKAFSVDFPAVVTCRTIPFIETISTLGAPLARAVVVEMIPVAISDLVAYLPKGQVSGASKWSMVVQYLWKNKDSVLAETLTSPLMSYLARAIYSGPEGVPNELLKFNSKTNLEEHLLDAYVGAVYPPPLPGERYPEFHFYAASDVKKWYASLAWHLKRTKI